MGVVGNREAEIAQEALVPSLGQVLDGDSTVDQLLLELEAQDDVHAVRRLVSLDADERRPHPVDRTIEGLRFQTRQRAPEHLRDPRREVVGERSAATDHVLPHAALRLVQPERLAGPERSALELSGNARLVEPVAALVHRTEQAHRQERLVPARGDANVVRSQPRREWVHGVVKAPAGVLEAHPVDYVGDQLTLALERERTVEARVIDGVRALGDRGYQRHELCLQLGEQRRHRRAPQARLEVIE